MINKQALKTIGSRILKVSFQAAQIGRQTFWLVDSKFNNAVTYIAKKTKASFQAAQIKRRALWLINSKFTNTFIYAPKSVWQLSKSIRALFIKIFRAMLKPLKSIGSWVFDEELEIWQMLSGFFNFLFSVKNKRQIIGIVGSLILIMGAFTPVFIIPSTLITKSITFNLFEIKESGWFVLALGIISIILIFWKKYKWLRFGLSFAFLPLVLFMFYHRGIGIDALIIDTLKNDMFHKITQAYLIINGDILQIIGYEIGSEIVKSALTDYEIRETIVNYVAEHMELGWGFGVLFLGSFLILISTIKISNPFNITR